MTPICAGSRGEVFMCQSLQIQPSEPVKSLAMKDRRSFGFWNNKQKEIRHHAFREEGRCLS